MRLIKITALSSWNLWQRDNFVRGLRHLGHHLNWSAVCSGDRCLTVKFDFEREPVSKYNDLTALRSSSSVATLSGSIGQSQTSQAF